MKVSSKYFLSQTVRARELTLLENIYPPPSVTCHVWRVTCHMSCVTCHIIYIYMYFVWEWGQSGEASRWRVCYQRGLPRLAYNRVRAIWRGILNKDNYEILRYMSKIFPFYGKSKKSFFLFKPRYLSIVSRSRGPDPGMPEVRGQIMFVHKASSAW